jgi:hypothetical protein
MTKLIPGATLVYERVDGTVYARYRDPPHNTIPRWVIGGESIPTILKYDDWKQMLLLSDSNTMFKKEFDKVVNLYYLLKDSQ